MSDIESIEMRVQGEKVHSWHRWILRVAGARNPETGNDSGYYGMEIVTVLKKLTWEDMGDNIEMQSKGSVSISLGESLCLCIRLKFTIHRSLPFAESDS